MHMSKLPSPGLLEESIIGLGFRLCNSMHPNAISYVVISRKIGGAVGSWDGFRRGKFFRDGH